MTSRQCLTSKCAELTDYEKIEVQNYNTVYFIGLPSAKKIRGSTLSQYNFGYDDERGDYSVVIGDHIAYRYEVLDTLGCGSFGQAVKAHDHKTGTVVALKLIRSKSRFQHQAGVELRILKQLNKGDQRDEHNIIRLNDYCVFRKHLVLDFELLSINLYEFIKSN